MLHIFSHRKKERIFIADFRSFIGQRQLLFSHPLIIGYSAVIKLPDDLRDISLFACTVQNRLIKLLAEIQVITAGLLQGFRKRCEFRNLFLCQVIRRMQKRLDFPGQLALILPAEKLNLRGSLFEMLDKLRITHRLFREKI